MQVSELMSREPVTVHHCAAFNKTRNPDIYQPDPARA